MRSVLVVVLVVMLSGCHGDPPPVTPVPTPSVTPVFASDEEALAAAEEAYKRYLAVADQIFAEGGSEPDRMLDVAMGEQLETDISGFIEVSQLRERGVGATTFRDVVLQQYNASAETFDVVVVYLCEDVSGVDVLDSDGQSIVSPNRPAQVTYEVAFGVPPHTSELRVSEKHVWAESC